MPEYNHILRFIDSYKEYGFTNCVYNASGYDFTLNISDRVVFAELETSWSKYIYHRHYLDKRFKNVELLILPQRIIKSSQPNYQKFRLLPEIILIMSRHIFYRWDIVNYSVKLIPADKFIKEHTLPAKE